MADPKLNPRVKSPKISNTSCLPKRHKQTVQTLIRLLLKKQSNQSLPCLYFVNSSPINPHFLIEQKVKSVQKIYNIP